jgi:hypothetical protein
MIECTSWYPYLMNRGRVAGVRSVIKRLGHQRFGPPDDATSVALHAIDDAAHLEQLSERLLSVASWEELLAPSAPTSSSSP